MKVEIHAKGKQKQQQKPVEGEIIFFSRNCSFVCFQANKKKIVATTASMCTVEEKRFQKLPYVFIPLTEI